MSITLYRKYRPTDFDEVFGQENIKKSIINALNEDKIAHAYLFNGPRGTGKTTIARLIAKGVNCLTKGVSANPCKTCENCMAITAGVSLDVIEIDAASNRGIDEIRVLKENINYRPVCSNKKVYIIDEVHMLTNEAFNALLKTLEEPPAHAIFILATTEIHKLPDTIISRCVTYNFTTLSKLELISMLKELAKKEKVKIDEESLELIYKKSAGSARDSLSLLEQVISSYYNEEITYEKTANALGVIKKEYFEKFNELIKNKEKKGTIDFINDIYKNGIQIDVFLKDFCDYLKVYEEDLDYTITLISNIYNTIAKFKNEDDLRIVSYIILYNIFENEYKLNSVSNNTVSVRPSNIEFNYVKFLEYLDSKNNYANNILSNFSLVKIENDILYIKQNNNRADVRSNIENLVIKEQFEEEIYNFLNARYKIIVVNDEMIRNSRFISDVLSLFEAERI